MAVTFVVSALQEMGEADVPAPGPAAKLQRTNAETRLQQRPQERHALSGQPLCRGGMRTMLHLGIFSIDRFELSSHSMRQATESFSSIDRFELSSHSMRQVTESFSSIDRF